MAGDEWKSLNWRYEGKIFNSMGMDESASAANVGTKEERSPNIYMSGRGFS